MRFLKNFFGGSSSDKPAPKPHSRDIHQFAEENQDLLAGYELHVTMAPTTPIAYLNRHGEVRGEIPAAEKSLQSPHFIWLPKLTNEFDFLDKGATMSSSVGYIPTDGGEFLSFLKDFRRIIEKPKEMSTNEMEDIHNRTSSILAMKDPNGYLRKLAGNEEDWVFGFVLRELNASCYKGLTIAHIKELHRKGYDSLNEMIQAPDDILLALKGIGKKKLELIRSNLGA